VPVRGSFWGWQEGHSAAAGEMVAGWTARFGLLNLAMVRNAGVEGQVWAGMFAIQPAKLAGAGGHRRFQPFGLFPAALRDIAVVVDASRHAAEVRAVVRQLAQTSAGVGFAVEAVGVFDVYQGTGLPEGRKSLAFSLTFRSQERTLTDEEVNLAFTKLQQEIARDGTMTVRA
jgi:phenylalanyl-tRNA synthetase beta chain